MTDEQQPITVTFPDKKTASAIVDLVVRKKPVGWARKSYATYYRPEYAEQLKRELDNMLETNKSKVFRYDMTPSLSPSSIYMWVNQSFRYILDFMDPDKKYLNLHHRISIERIKGVGVTISFRPLCSDSFKGVDFVAREDKVKWKKKMDDYLSDNDNIKPLHIDNLVLTSEEVVQLKSELEELTNIQYSVSSREIKLIKTT